MEEECCRLPGELRHETPAPADSDGIAVPAELLARIRALAGEPTHA